MNVASNRELALPPEQQAIRDKCFHPSGTFVEFPSEDVEASIPARFEKIVRIHPRRLAIKDGDRSLSYEVMNRTVNRIARSILALRGNGSESIALLFEHGFDVIAALLGTLKAGKLYVVLSPSFPPARNRFMCHDSQARLILTNSANFDAAVKLAEEPLLVLNIDTIDEALPSDNLGGYPQADDLATIRYTSGSTGYPKGIAENHRKILLQARLTTNDENHICAEDRVTLLHSVAFGSAYPHLYGSLLNGACLLPFDVKSNSIESLARWITAEQVTIFKSPPQIFRQLAKTLAGAPKLPALRLIHISGAPITQRDFDAYQTQVFSCALLEISMGATEVRGICYALLDPCFSFPQGGSPVGYPRRGRQVVLLDDSGREVEPGDIGEIAVKGRDLSLGYWQNPELTETKLIDDLSTDNQQTYLTGDLGRRMSDGMIVHLGRKDLMVKVRGYRVDLTEIERALSTHGQIQEGVVSAWERHPGNVSLAGYIVTQPESALSAKDLRVFLRNKLPDFMIPSTFTFVQSLPLTNGKIDRKALPNPDNKRPDMPAAYVPPRSVIESCLGEIWAEVLEIHPVGIHDNFFELGGHSLAALRIISRVIKTFQLELPVKALFDAPTVAQMAALIDGYKDQPIDVERLDQLLNRIENTTEAEAAARVAVVTGDRFHG